MDFLPSKDGDRISWFTNLMNKVDEVKAALGVSDAEADHVKALCGLGIAKLQAVPNALATYDSAVEAKTAMEKTGGEINEIRSVLNQWKASDGFTTTIGATLNVMGGGNDVDLSNYKCSATASIEGNVVRLKFKKLGADSVNIYKRKKGSLEWTFLARDTSSPYDDHIALAVPGQPEHWEYIVFGVLKDAQFGSPTDIIQIVYG